MMLSAAGRFAGAQTAQRRPQGVFRGSLKALARGSITLYTDAREPWWER
jgi:hypothetical protein